MLKIHLELIIRCLIYVIYWDSMQRTTQTPRSIPPHGTIRTERIRADAWVEQVYRIDLL